MGKKGTFLPNITRGSVQLPDADFFGLFHAIPVCHTFVYHILVHHNTIYSFQCTDLSNPLLRSFNSFWLSFADKVMTGTRNFVSLIVKTISSELSSALSVPVEAKTQCFVHLSFNSILQLINGISSDFQKLLRYFNGTATVVFLKILCLLIISLYIWKT